MSSQDKTKSKPKSIIKECVDRLKSGKLPPWKVEDEIETAHGIQPPENFKNAALCRQQFIEDVTGESFNYIHLTDKPYKVQYQCETHEFICELDALDEHRVCSQCGSLLKPTGQYAALVANFVGGIEDYYSYAGRIRVKGDVNKEFTNLLVYGTGLGPMGITKGCFIINRFGGAEVRVSEFARAARCLGLLFKTEEMRNKALKTVEAFLPDLKSEMNKKMSETGGRLSSVEYVQVENQRGFILYVDFAANFTDFRGHGGISHAVGYAKREIEQRLQDVRVQYDLSVIAQGYDGDLKPSPRNKRGRYASAQFSVPIREFEKFLKKDVEAFLSFVEIDYLGSQKLGCQFYSGMGGEIIPALYRATKVNPRSCLVSSFQNIYARVENGEVIYGVDLPNVEVGILSSQEGLIPPVGREALRIMGIQTAREFAACLAAQVLAGEFNLAVEIVREKLYDS
jgi:hypothetical protein